MSPTTLWRSLVLALLAVAACSGEDPAARGAPAAEPSPTQPAVASLVTSTGLRIELRTAPSQPPARGDSTVEYFATDEDGTPVDGLSLSVVPWMPVMGHGTSVHPTVRPKGGGRYEIEHVVLFMPGQWDLRTTITGARTDQLAPSFQVP